MVMTSISSNEHITPYNRSKYELKTLLYMCHYYTTWQYWRVFLLATWYIKKYWRQKLKIVIMKEKWFYNIKFQYLHELKTCLSFFLTVIRITWCDMWEGKQSIFEYI